MPDQTPRTFPMKKMNNSELTFGYSTLAHRAGDIKFPSKNDNREFIVVVQNPNNEQYKVESEKTKVLELKNKGVAKSRNAVLQNATGKYLIFGDDDITFDEAGLSKMLDYFAAHPDCAIIMAQAVDETGKLRKSYPSKQHRLTRFNSAKAATYEMMVRVDAIREKNITFDENFGAGVENYLGDEYIFISDALRSGLKGVFLPVVVAIHPKDSSGSKWGTREDLAARAKVFTRVFGVLAPLMRALFLLKSRKGSVGMVGALRFIIGR